MKLNLSYGISDVLLTEFEAGMTDMESGKRFVLRANVIEVFFVDTKTGLRVTLNLNCN